MASAASCTEVQPDPALTLFSLWLLFIQVFISQLSLFSLPPSWILLPPGFQAVFIVIFTSQVLTPALFCHI